MSFKRSTKRYAHVHSYTFVCYSEDGEQIITSGSQDGDIRIWKEISDDDPTSFCIGETATCCAYYTHEKHQRLIAATDNNSVQCFSFPSGERDGLLFRFTAPVTSIKVNHKWIAAGSEDFSIKAQKRGTTDELIELKGHYGTILQMDISSTNLLASSSGDGTIIIWNLEESGAIVKKFEGFEIIKEFSSAKLFSTPSFDPKGSLLAFPKDFFIHVVDVSTWDIKFKLENTFITEKYSVCNISTCGSFLAAGSVTGEISVWNLVDRSALKGEYSGEDIHGITSIAWNPSKRGEFAFCDADGQLSTILTGVSSNPNGLEDHDFPVNDDEDLYGGLQFDGGSDDEENINCVSLEKLKTHTLKNESDSEDDDDAKTVRTLLSTGTHSEQIVMPKPFELQPSFQPGSTPSYLEHRFMVWNHVGQVIAHSSEENSIITEFHDVTIHPSLHILNTLNHEMASLSETCLLLATKDTPCRLVCIAFVSAGGKEWSTTMPECEEIYGIAAGRKFVAVATDAGFIRLFTTMGTQREVISVPGHTVALSAYENKLVVVYHSSNTRNKFSLMIVTILEPSVSNRFVEVPLTTDAKLSWIGFSDMGSIIVYDSTKRVISYDIKKNLWFPICDMNEHVTGGSDSFFIISVSEKNQKIRATLCRGLNYPLTSPRPIVREIDYSLPLCYMETEKSKLEEGLIRATTFQMELAEKIVVEKGLKLFSSAINSELESRAYEIVELLGNKTLIELASKYASQKGRIHMANKITKLLFDYEEKEMKKIEQLNEIEKEVESFNETYERQSKIASEITLKDTSTPIIAPKPMISQKKSSNPFKKFGSLNKNSSASSLTHLTKKSIGLNDCEKNSDDENTPSNNVSKINRSTTVDTPRPGNFMQWYIANKSDLKANNSTASDVELLKIGKNLYKELTQKQKSPEEENNDTKNQTLQMNKRKLNLNDSEGGISKLAKYGFIQD
ncbi:CLUMA_CG005767, isoform A [Clunio marinus]|uniref:CLUMA_CG005767, isoform A n=1 Tax=Clunio marinus TaxID=568069 RepID=A0A1J1HXU8_9DIPT|nr:CLUMA_CG005767, isoform A [Clunio marinus]